MQHSDTFYVNRVHEMIVSFLNYSEDIPCLISNCLF